MKDAFQYGEQSQQVIPEGSAVFTGTYKGNPAYNVVLLKDENGKIVEGSQIIMADDPQDGQLGNVSKGTWIYWIEPKDMDKLPKGGSVKAELYRVDDAQTNANPRLVSDTLYIDVPTELPPLKLEGGVVLQETKEAIELLEEIENEQDVVDTTNNEQNVGDATELAPAPIDITEIPAPLEYNTQKHAECVSCILKIDGNVVRQGTVTADENNNPQFSFKPSTNDNKKAVMSLNLGDSNAEKTIALQTSFTISDPNVTDVMMNWSEIITKRALLYDRNKNTVTLYVIADQDLLDGGVMTLGEISMKSAGGNKFSTLTLKPDSTILVNNTFNNIKVANLTGGVELEIENNGNTSGNSSGSTSGSTSGSGAYLGVASSGSSVASNNKPNIVDVATVFNDIKKDAWYYNAVQHAYEKSWFMGTSETEFTSNRNMTRGMFVTVLGRFAGATGTPNTKFTDVSSDQYYAGFVAWASEQGIVNGISENKFAPESYITREQLAVMIYGYLRSEGVELDTTNEKKAFNDDTEISVWANEAVYVMQQSGLIHGMPDGSFQPKGTATRAEVATVMMNLEAKIKKNK